jgi:hypothetical protein
MNIPGLPESPQVSDNMQKQWIEILTEWQTCWKLAATKAGHPLLSKPEQSNTGILAGAAWRKGFVAFREMSRKKGKAQIERWGYNDLYICSVDGLFSCYLECKGGWVPDKSAAARLLRGADNDTKELMTGDTVSGKVALAFCNTQVPDNTRDVSARIQQLHKEIMELEHNAIAWCFPEDTRNLREGAFIIPGVTLLAKRLPPLPS